MTLTGILQPGKRYVLFADGRRLEGVVVRLDPERVVLRHGSRTTALASHVVTAVLEPYGGPKIGRDVA